MPHFGLILASSISLQQTERLQLRRCARGVGNNEAVGSPEKSSSKSQDGGAMARWHAGCRLSVVHHSSVSYKLIREGVVRGEEQG